MTDQTLHLTPEEATELALMLNRETASAAVELRHTSSREYKERIRHRMEVIASMLTKMDHPAMEPHGAST